jgi:hypothetical protein
VLTLVLYLLAIRLIQPVRRWRLDWRAVLTALALLALLGGATALAFLVTAGRYEKWDILATPTPAPPVPVVMERQVAIAVPPAPLPTDTPAPTDTPQVTPVPPPILVQEESTAIYAAVARQLYTVDHTFGDQPPNFPVIYLVRITDDNVGDPDAPESEPQELPEALQKAIVAGLEDLPAEFIWVDSADEVPRDNKTHAVLDGGAIITLGNIHLQEDGSALVSAQLYFSMLGATGKTYILKQADSTWQVTGDTGVQWIS